MNAPKDLDQQIAARAQQAKALAAEIHRTVVGQQKMVNRLLIGLFTNGHVLLEGAPGLAKTLTVSTLARALSLKYSRIQFTPDLLPSDVVGTLIYNQQKGAFEVKTGPIFANIVLADEINRSPAKVQSALLEAMQEKQVTLGDTTYRLPSPFLVLATQNPLEQEGTYPLPEAQVDRFMMKVYVDYPTAAEEREIMRRMASTAPVTEVKAVMSAEDIAAIRQLINHVRLETRLEDYIVSLVMASRDPKAAGLSLLVPYLQYGASPRATIALSLASRAHALMAGRSYVMPDDVKAVAPDVLNHRLLLTFEAEADSVTQIDCVQELLDKLPI